MARALLLSQDTYLGNNSAPPSLNRYLYAYSNPALYADPTGHAPVLDETGQYMMDTGKRLLDNVDEDSGVLETAFYGFTAGANYFVGGVIETVNFGVNIATSTSLFSDDTRARANQELGEAFGTINHLNENKGEVAETLVNKAGTTIGEAAAGNSRAQAELIAFGTGLLGSKGQNSILSANRTAAVVNSTKTVTNAIKNNKMVVSATNTVERSLTSGGNRIAALNQSAVEGVKQATKTIIQHTRNRIVDIARPQVEIYGFRGGGGGRKNYPAEVTKRNFWHEASNFPEVYSGHVGFSVNRGKTIWGYGPNKPKNKPYGDFLNEIAENKSFPGGLHNDTRLFKKAMAGDFNSSIDIPSLGVHKLTMSVGWRAMWKIKSEIRRRGKGHEYQFPFREAPYYRPNNRNCATFLSFCAVDLPEESGNLRLFIPELIK